MSQGTAPTPWAPSSTTGMSSSGESRRGDSSGHPADVRAGNQARARSDCFVDLKKGRHANRHAVQNAGGPERSEQAGMLLVAGENLIAFAQAEPVDHACEPLASACGERELRGLAAERAGVGAGAAPRPVHCDARSGRQRGRARPHRGAPRRPPAALAAGGPSVPAFRYAKSPRTGNSSRSASMPTDDQHRESGERVPAGTIVRVLHELCKTEYQLGDSRWNAWSGYAGHQRGSRRLSGHGRLGRGSR